MEIEDFDESQQHTLADFVRLSQGNCIILMNLPKGVTPGKAALR